MAQIGLNPSQVKIVKDLADKIAGQVEEFVKSRSSVSVERAILRLYGVDGIDKEGVPLPNTLVEMLRKKDRLSSGVSKHFAAAMLKTGKDASSTAQMIANGDIDFGNITDFSRADILKQEEKLCDYAVSILDRTRKTKKQKQAKFPVPPNPWKYLIVATGIGFYLARVAIVGIAPLPQRARNEF